MNQKRQNVIFTVLGTICALGCLTISGLNAYWGSHPRADVIPPSEYTASLASSAAVEEDNGGSAENQATEQDTININTATADELASFLPGIGDVKAKRIVEYRETSGGFDSVDELINVKGIGEKTLQNIRPYCRVSG